MTGPRAHAPRWIRRLRARFGPGLPVWHHDAYRIPLTTVEARVGLDPRRADHALVWLLHERATRPEDVHSPGRMPYHQLGRVHTPALLERLTHPEELARVLGVEAWDIDVDGVLDAIRHGCAGTLAAARYALGRGGATLNLFGGFHHAGRDRAGGHCAFNDLAVAVVVLRGEGFAGRVVILDLDAHPPDGTVDTLGDDPKVWIGSLSGCDWGPMPAAAATVDETVLPDGADDTTYLAALDGLLDRMPEAELAFVIAGGDVLAADRLGLLGVSLAGARERDRRVAARLGNTPAVWLPGGGYTADAWRVLAGSGLALAWDDAEPIPAGVDPLRLRFSRIASRLGPEHLGPLVDDGIDLAVELGLRRRNDGRLLGYYTAGGLELALERYGVIPALRRLGYRDFRVHIDANELGERFRLVGHFGPPAADAPEHLLVEVVLERVTLSGQRFLYVHWLTLRHPAGAFRSGRAPLPGQEVPGLGLAREAGELLGIMASRLDLAGVALRPAHYHVAYACRDRFGFVDPERQGRFLALVEAARGMDPGHVSRAVGGGRVKLDGAPYTWEPDLMVEWAPERAPDAAWHARVDEVRAACRFEVPP